MSTEINILWVDDNKDRDKDAKDLEKMNSKISAKWIHPVNFFIELNQKKAARDVDLFLVDYGLSTRPQSEDNHFDGEGLSLIGRIRENYPDIPVYLYSSDDNSDVFNKLAYTAKKEAEQVMTLDKILKKGFNLLHIDALYYKQIKEKSGKNVNDIIGLLSPPQEETETIEYILPDVFRKELSDKSGPLSKIGESLSFSKWVREDFLENPGFVYDALHAATLTGMTVDAYLKRSKEFEPALYTGIFSKTLDFQLWWKSSIEKLLFQKLPPADPQTDIRLIAQKYFSLGTQEMAKCVVCKENLPDLVAYDPKTNSFEPAHLRCSKADPTFMRRMYFDEQRTLDLEETK